MKTETQWTDRGPWAFYFFYFSIHLPYGGLHEEKPMQELKLQPGTLPGQNQPIYPELKNAGEILQNLLNTPKKQLA